MTGTLYRAIKEPPVGEKDFLSKRELGEPCEGDQCLCSGLSVWPSLEAVEHARKISRYFRAMNIASGQISENDGLIRATPTRRQPQHHTFWRDIRIDLSKKFTIHLSPSVE